jgi:hypothetical protein
MEHALPAKAYNVQKLIEETGWLLIGRGDTLYIIVDDNITQTELDAIDAVANAHDPSLTTEQDLTDAKTTLIVQARDYLNNKMAEANPDTDAIYAQISTQVASRPVLQQMMDNQIALQTLATGWVQGNHTPAENKRFYIWCFQMVVAILG